MSKLPGGRTLIGSKIGACGQKRDRAGVWRTRWLAIGPAMRANFDSPVERENVSITTSLAPDRRPNRAVKKTDPAPVVITTSGRSRRTCLNDSTMLRPIRLSTARRPFFFISPSANGVTLNRLGGPSKLCKRTLFSETKKHSAFGHRPFSSRI